MSVLIEFSQRERVPALHHLDDPIARAQVVQFKERSFEKIFRHHLKGDARRLRGQTHASLRPELRRDVKRDLAAGYIVLVAIRRANTVLIDDQQTFNQRLMKARPLNRQNTRPRLVLRGDRQIKRLSK